MRPWEFQQGQAGRLLLLGRNFRGSLGRLHLSLNVKMYLKNKGLRRGTAFLTGETIRKEIEGKNRKQVQGPRSIVFLKCKKGAQWFLNVATQPSNTKWLPGLMRA